MTTGIVRKLDSLGRVVIPKELRDVLGIEEHAVVECHIEDGDMVLSRDLHRDVVTVRKFDDLGRVVIPKEMRQVLCIGPKSSVEIFTRGENIVVRPYVADADIYKALEGLSTAVENSDLSYKERLAEAITGAKNIIREEEM